MQDLNWWLMALAFLLGLILTLFLLIRRVKREVPVYASLAGGAAVAGAAGAAGAAKLAGGRSGAADADAIPRVPKIDADVDADATARVPKLDVDAGGDLAKPGAVAAGAAAAGVAGGAATAKFAGSSTESGKEPYGPGSARVSAGAVAPSGYDIKGNEDSMLYHTPESNAYDETVAEVWFRDVPTAEAAGFNRWDSGKSQRWKR
jgi:hypothetical protein